MSCKYQNIFGEPNTGVHKYRLFNIAIVDLAMTIGIAFLIARWFKLNFLIVLLMFLILGIIAHRVFCVRTTIDKLLFE